MFKHVKKFDHTAIEKESKLEEKENPIQVFDSFELGECQDEKNIEIDDFEL